MSATTVIAAVALVLAVLNFYLSVWLPYRRARYASFEVRVETLHLGWKPDWPLAEKESRIVVVNHGPGVATNVLVDLGENELMTHTDLGVGEGTYLGIGEREFRMRALHAGEDFVLTFMKAIGAKGVREVLVHWDDGHARRQSSTHHPSRRTVT